MPDLLNLMLPSDEGLYKNLPLWGLQELPGSKKSYTKFFHLNFDQNNSESTRKLCEFSANLFYFSHSKNNFLKVESMSLSDFETCFYICFFNYRSDMCCSNTFSFFGK